MPSELLMYYLSIDESKTPDWKKGEEEIARLEGVHMVEWPEDFLMYYGEEWAGSSVSKADPDMNDRTSNVAMLKDELANLKKAWNNEYSDAAMCEIGTKRVLFTGGMSYGSPPSDTYTTVQKLLYAGITGACGFD